MQKLYQKIVFTILLILSINIAQAKTGRITCSMPIVSDLVKPLFGTQASVSSILKTGQNPMEFSPSKDDILKMYNANLFIYISDDIEPWTLDMPAAIKLRLIDFIDDNDKIILSIQQKDSLTYDTLFAQYFWTDPLICKNVISKLSDTLVKIFPNLAASIQSNLSNFLKRLDLLDVQIAKILRQVRNFPIFFETSAWRYFCNRYKLIHQGELATHCSKNSTPSELETFNNLVKKYNMGVIFAGSSCGQYLFEYHKSKPIANIYTLDVFNLQFQKKNYPDLLLANAEVFRRAMQ